MHKHKTLSYNNAQSIQSTYKFLIHLHTNLHFSTKKKHNILNQNKQLQITNTHNFKKQSNQHPIKQFIQTYFQHTTTISQINNHFVDQHQPKSFLHNALNQLITHHFDKIHKIKPHKINVTTTHLNTIYNNIKQILHLYHTTLLYDTQLSPKLINTIHTQITKIKSINIISHKYKKIFHHILHGTNNTNHIIHKIYTTNVLKYIIPKITHTHKLLQFNQYHSFTINEHTLQTIKTIQQFEYHKNTLNTTYHTIQHKTTLHLTLLLHNSNKNFKKNHNIINTHITQNIKHHLQINNHKHKIIKLLVLKHLSIPHLTFQHNISDTNLLIHFAHKINNPKQLQILYVLSTTNISTINPNT